ncbi:MAG: histidine--tRNA ligase [Acidimicrobiia bacterium]
MNSFRRPKGTEDILPPESQVWRDAHRVFDDMCERFGYGLTLTPMFEDTEVFTRGVGGDTEVVQKQMYSFEDKSGRPITLRPEATASVVRAAIQAGGVPTRFKGSYWGPMFRYERPQKGRNRQFYQAGIEYLGSDSAEADVEVIEFGYRYLAAMGVSDIEVRVNSIGDPADRKEYEEALIAFLESRREELSPDAQKRITTNPMRILDSKADAAIVIGAPIPLDFIGAAAAEHFAAVRAGLDTVGIPYVVDHTMVRGLDYYNRTVWEYVPTSYEAAQSSVGGGGRYDGLFEVLGGKPTPGVGLAMGVDRILLASTTAVPEVLLDAFVVAASDDYRSVARTLTSQLREAGWRADMTDRARPIKAQFKDADRTRAAAAIVVGAEWEAGSVTVKRLATGEQELIAVKEIDTWLRA